MRKRRFISILCLSAVALVLCLSARARPTFSVDIVETETGGTTLNIDMANHDDDVIVVQCDIKLPEGVTLMVDSYLDPIVNLSERKADHVVVASWIELLRVYRVLIYSNKNSIIKGSEGLLFSAPLEVACSPGEYSIEVRDILVTYPNLREVECDATYGTMKVAEPFVAGDVNSDGNVTSVDIALTVSKILGKKPNSFNEAAADMNNDGRITSVDIARIVSIILGINHTAMA